jgi:hypothetical protein
VHGTPVSSPPASTDAAALTELVSYLPPRIWYLTSNGVDMWCRRPYGFFFSTGEAAEKFAADFGSDYGLSAIGVDTSELLQDDVLGALRGLEVTRLFLDPAIDPESGDVFGKILRLADVN